MSRSLWAEAGAGTHYATFEGRLDALLFWDVGGRVSVDLEGNPLSATEPSWCLIIAGSPLQAINLTVVCRQWTEDPDDFELELEPWTPDLDEHERMRRLDMAKGVAEALVERWRYASRPPGPWTDPDFGMAT